MKTQVHKISGNKNHIHTDAFKKSDANSSTLLRTKGNTGTAIVQQKLQDALNASPRLHQLKAYQEMADTHAFLHNKPAPKKQTGITANTVSQRAVHTNVVPGSKNILPHENRKQATSKESNPKAASIPANTVIQRAVGYEFETGWITKREISLNNYVPMKKKEPIGFSKFDGFKMEADEAGEGEGEIEFIVHPPIEEGESGYKKLEDIMDGMEMFGSVLEARKTPFTLNEVTNNPSDKMFKVHPDAEGLKAGPQVTSGLDLAKIQDLKNINDRQDPKSPLHGLLNDKRDGKVPKELESNITTLSKNAQEISQKVETSQELNGLLVVLKNYLEIGGNKNKNDELTDEIRWGLALSYPKIIADRLLARTNFVKLFKLIPAREQKKYKSNPQAFVSLIKEILPDYIHIKDSIIARGVKNHEEDPKKGITIPNLTIEQFILDLITKETDLIPTRIKDAESLGEMGEKTESVGEEGRLFGGKRDVGIFEFRGAQTTKIPLKRWKPFALEFQRYISTVHRD